MRGGTSRGAYFNAADVPRARDKLGEFLIAAMGAGSPLQVDGVGGGQPTTSKAAVLSRADHEWAEIDYLFAQVHTTRREVDFTPNCGNILAGVAPAALEMGLATIDGATTRVRIRNLNTDALVEAHIETPNNAVNYVGDAQIAGVPGGAAPVRLNFMNVVGAASGALLPTGNARDRIDGVEVSCVDVAMPMVFARCEDFGVSLDDAREPLDANAKLFEKIERLRIQAGAKMNLGDVRNKVIPKVALLARARQGGHIAARYLTPWTFHPSYAVTGALCTGASALCVGALTAELAAPCASGKPFVIEHLSGVIEAVFNYEHQGDALTLHSAGILRTARKIFAGEIFTAGK